MQSSSLSVIALLSSQLACGCRALGNNSGLSPVGISTRRSGPQLTGFSFAAASEPVELEMAGMPKYMEFDISPADYADDERMEVCRRVWRTRKQRFLKERRAHALDMEQCVLLANFTSTTQLFFIFFWFLIGLAGTSSISQVAWRQRGACSHRSSITRLR